MAIIKQDDGRIINTETGLIAVEYYQPRYFSIAVANGARSYTFTDRGMCLSWVMPEDVEEILSMKGGCCGQKKAGVFRIPQDLRGVIRWIG